MATIRNETAALRAQAESMISHAEHRGERVSVWLRDIPNLCDEVDALRAELAARPAFTRKDWRVIEGALVALVRWVDTTEGDGQATLIKVRAMHEAAVQADRDAIDAERRG